MARANSGPFEPNWTIQISASMAAGSLGADSAIGRNRPRYRRGEDFSPAILRRSSSVLALRYSSWKACEPACTPLATLDTDLGACSDPGSRRGLRPGGPGVSVVQSQTWIFQRPGGRGSFRKVRAVEIDRRAIEPSFVRVSIKLSASRDPVGRPADSHRRSGIEGDRNLAPVLALDVHDEEPGLTNVVHGLDLDVSDAAGRPERS